MMWVQVVLRLLVGEGPEGTRQRQRVRVFVVILGLIGLVGLAGTGWVVSQAGIYGWQTEDWERLFPALLLSWTFLAMLFIVPLMLVILNIAPSGFTQPLRELVASGDLRISYPGAIQPLPLLPQERAVGGQTFQKLRVTEGWRDRRRFFGVVPGLAVLILMALGNLPQALGFGYSADWLGWFSFALLLAGVGVFIGAIVVLISTLSGQRTRLSITTDEQGLTWQGGKRGRRQQIGWNAVRSFSVMVYEGASSLSSKQTTFLVDGGDALLTWTLYSGSGMDEYGESWQLSRHVVTHSGKLLRDLTPLAMSLRMTSAKPTRLRGIGAPELLITTITAMKRRFYRIWFVGVPLMVGLFALLFVSLPGNYFARDYQQRYFAGLVPKIHAGRQLYHNALTTGDNEWQTRTAINDDQMSLGVVDGAYQMSGPQGKFADFTISPHFGDMAVEVTVRLSGPTTKYSGAGLIIRSNDSENDMVVFSIDPLDGYWSLARYKYDFVNPDKDWHSLDYGMSSAIVKGDGAKNTLLALARGDVILLYINGRFLHSYSAQDHFNENNYGMPPLIHSGYVGVYDNDAADVARFNDFTVYAIKSPPSLEYA